jgi:hypothetical protein
VENGATFLAVEGGCELERGGASIYARMRSAALGGDARRSLPGQKSPAEFPGRVRLYSSDLFVAERDDFRAEDFFAPVFRELDAIDFLAPDFEEAERDFADDFLLAPGDLAIANVLSFRL